MTDEELKTSNVEAETAIDDVFVQKAYELNETVTAALKEVIDVTFQFLVDVGLAKRIEAEPHHKRNRRRRKHRQ